MNKQNHGSPFSVTGSGNNPLTVNQTASTNTIYFVTDISVSASTTQNTWSLVAGPTGTTTLWQGSGVVNMDFNNPIQGVKGGSVAIISTGTGTLYASISGFSILAQ